ncbi:hypothetical protein HU200_011364 [Digitaria exilis]|uniref:Uncharacterized protein n=1 Tax=Digitaria exilis TaxID=1010633 RepID=A0A835KMS2_9POAL|nr:hypothetical protein HU200_011364 [Digitaria exilis]
MLHFIYTDTMVEGRRAIAQETKRMWEIRMLRLLHITPAPRSVFTTEINTAAPEVMTGLVID